MSDVQNRRPRWCPTSGTTQDEKSCYISCPTCGKRVRTTDRGKIRPHSGLVDAGAEHKPGETLVQHIEGLHESLDGLLEVVLDHATKGQWDGYVRACESLDFRWQTLRGAVSELLSPPEEEESGSV